MTPINYDKYKGHTKDKFSIVVGNQPFGMHPSNRITYFRIIKEGDECLTHEEIISDESRANADLFADAPLILQRCMELEAVKEAAKALIEDVRERYPNEDLRCPHMIRLDQALSRAEEGE